MSDIRFNRWLHQSGTGGVYQASSGNVGIGTSVPSTTLDVNGSISATSISATSITATTGTITGNLSVGGVLTYDDVTNIDSVGVITARSDVSIADKIIHTGDTNTAIRFPAADTFTVETAATERLRIDSSGRVLISGGAALTSTSQPHPVQIAAASDASAVVIFGRASDDIGELSYFEADKTTRLGEIQYRQDHVNFRHRKGDIRFWTHPTGGTTERLRITSGGKLATNGASSIDCGDGGMHLYLGDGARNDYSTSADGLIIEKNGNTGLSIDPGSSGTANIYFPNESNHSIAQISHNNSTGEFRIRGEDHIILSTNGNTERLRVDSAGKILIGSGAIANPKVTTAGAIDISNSDWAIVMGGSGSDNRADAANKDGRFAGAHYTNAEEPIGLVRSYSTSSANEVHIGGGSSLINAATQLSFYTATNTTTTGGSERLRITSEGRLHLGNGGHGTTKVGGQEISGQDYSALLKLYDTRANIWGMQMRRDTGTGPNGIFVRAGNTSSNYSLYVCGTNESNTHLVCRGDGNVGVNTKDPSEKLHIVGAVRRDHSTSNIKFYEFSFTLPDGATTTIATVSNPVVSSMAIAKFEYVGLYGYNGTGFYSGVEMASLRRSSGNSVYTYLQNSEIHAGGNNSSYQPNIFWQNGSNNTSDLMITTGSYVQIMGTIRITTFNLDFSRSISV